jgi:ankyrin repeat protein
VKSIKFILSIIAVLTLANSRAFSAVQSMEELNADLLKKKSDLQPFDDKKVKIDIESLGLDDLDKKSPVIEETRKPNLISNVVSEPPKEKEPEILPEIVQPKEEKGEDKIIDKIKNLIHLNEDSAKTSEVENEKSKPINLPKSEAKKVGKTSAVNQKNTKNKTLQYINSSKKKALKRRLEQEKQKKINEKKRQEKLKKLQELREKYLKDGAQNSFDDEDIVLPQKKEIDPFRSEELPAQPILDRYRTRENLHIPIILTPAERVAILFNGISSGNVEYFNSAYKDVANPNVRNIQGDTALTYAIILQKHSIVASILGKGANPNMPNSLGYTPIDIAIELLDLKTLELLANNNADLNYLDAFKRTYLMHASRVGFLPAVELFVMNGVDINAIDKDGFTALAIAYRHKKEVIVKYLLKNGAKTWVEKPFDPESSSLIKELETRWNN